MLSSSPALTSARVFVSQPPRGSFESVIKNCGSHVCDSSRTAYASASPALATVRAAVGGSAASACPIPVDGNAVNEIVSVSPTQRACGRSFRRSERVTHADTSAAVGIAAMSIPTQLFITEVYSTKKMPGAVTPGETD